MRHPNWDNLTDTQRTYWLLKQAGAKGMHSWELAEQVPTRNASQRVKDTVSKGFPCFTVAERRNGRAGARYWLHGAPDFAVPVAANNSDAAETRIETGAEVDIGKEKEPQRLRLVLDYTGDEPAQRWEVAA